jgi:hypothetical protein
MFLTLCFERVGQLVADLIANDVGNADPTGLGECFEARRDIDAVAKDVAALGDDVAEVDANAKPDAPLVGRLGLAVDHPALHLGGATHPVDDAGKLHQQPVACGLDDAPVVLGDLWIDQLPAMRFEALECPLLVRSHQPRIACHIGGEDRGETAGRGHGYSSPPGSRLSALAVIRQNRWAAEWVGPCCRQKRGSEIKLVLSRSAEAPTSAVALRMAREKNRIHPARSRSSGLWRFW